MPRLMAHTCLVYNFILLTPLSNYSPW